MDKCKNANLEVEDDGPYQSQCEFWIAVDDVFGSDVNQSDLLAVKEVERRVHVVKHVKTHDTSFAWLKVKEIC